MNWIATHKDILAILIATCSLMISAVALILSRKTASLNTQFKQSGILEELHDKVRPGRQAMEHIWDQWVAGTDKTIESLSEKNEEQFVAFYNKDYHNCDFVCFIQTIIEVRRHWQLAWWVNSLKRIIRLLEENNTKSKN